MMFTRWGRTGENGQTQKKVNRELNTIERQSHLLLDTMLGSIPTRDGCL